MTTSQSSTSKTSSSRGKSSERQRDVQTREVKCVVAGVTLDGSVAEVVVKVGFGGKLVVITVYLC